MDKNWFHPTQTETTNRTHSVEVANLKIVYNLEHQIGQDGQFASYLREFVAISNQYSTQSSGSQTLVPIETSSENGGQLTLVTCQLPANQATIQP